MKRIIFLLLLYLINCFTVYKKDETVLKRETLVTKDLKEERDVYVLSHTLTEKGLHLFLDAYRMEEKSRRWKTFVLNMQLRGSTILIKAKANLLIAIIILTAVIISPKPLRKRRTESEPILERLLKIYYTFADGGCC